MPCLNLPLRSHQLVPQAARQMASGTHGERPDHLTRTAHERRSDVVTEAEILEVRDETPTVREFLLDVKDPAFTFQAGNWVDFFIEGVDKVGGYSMCSVPAELPRLRLAVKASRHPPAAWCHSPAAAPGVCVHMKAGGEFAWDPSVDGPSTKHLLLVAGGIGINPLYSMLQQAVATAPEAAPGMQRITLLYSAAKPSELAYRRHMEELAARDDRVRLELRVTRNSEPAGPEPWNGGVGRITVDTLREAVAQSGFCSDDTLAYVCGPPQMTDDIVAALVDEVSVPSGSVRFEKWW